jgi:hypothetical protein
MFMSWASALVLEAHSQDKQHWEESGMKDSQNLRIVITS